MSHARRPWDAVRASITNSDRRGPGHVLAGRLDSEAGRGSGPLYNNPTGGGLDLMRRGVSRRERVGFHERRPGTTQTRLSQHDKVPPGPSIAAGRGGGEKRTT
jgi:hypothetical protein